MRVPFTTRRFIKSTQLNLKETLGTKRVLCAYSGGVDSSTVVALLHSSNVSVIPLIIDTGFLRAGEVKEVTESLQVAKLPTLTILNKQKYFYACLKNKVTADEKRLAFKDAYFSVLSEYISKHSIQFLGQGTRSKQEKNSRLYHNYATATFKKLKIKMIEPLIDVPKSLTRIIAAELGLSPATVTRKSFPGPGLLLRFGGELTPEKISCIREATEIVDAFVVEHTKSFKQCYQIFPYLIDGTPVVYLANGKVKTGYMLSIRSVREVANGFVPFLIPRAIQDQLIQRLLSVKLVGRVCFDLTPKSGQPYHPLSGAPIEYQ